MAFQPGGYSIDVSEMICLLQGENIESQEPGARVTNSLLVGVLCELQIETAGNNGLHVNFC